MINNFCVALYNLHQLVRPIETLIMPKFVMPDLAALQALVFPIVPEDSMSEAGRKVLLTHFIDLLTHQETVANDDLMWAAAQRLRNALRIFEPYYTQRALKPLLKGLRPTTRILNKLHQVDMRLKTVKGYQTMQEGEGADTFLPILETLNTYRQDLSEDLLKWFGSKQYARFLKGFARFVTTSGLGSITPKTATDPYQVRHVVPVLVHQQLAQVRAFDSHLDTLDAPLHALWIQFKRMNALLNVFGDNLGTSANEFLEESKVIEDHLSQINPTDAPKRLSDRRLLSEEQIEALGFYRQSLDEQREKLSAEFADLWTRFNTRTVQRKLADALLVTR